MRVLVLAAVLSSLAGAASAAEICMPTQAEEAQVGETMMRIKDPDFDSLGKGHETVAGCGIWSLDVGADGRVKAIKSVRLDGGEPLRFAVEPWLRKLTFEPQAQAWTALMPVTLETGGKK